MSVVIGIVESGDLVFASDSLVSDGSIGKESSLPKVFKRKVYNVAGTKSYELGFGIVGSPGLLLGPYMMIDALPDFTGDPHRIDSCDVYIMKHIVPAIAAWDTKRNMDFGLEASGSSIMIGFCGNIYTVDAEFNVLRTVELYDAIGSGYQLAIGALDGFKKAGAWYSRTRQEIAKDVIRIVSDHDMTCGGNPLVVNIYFDI